MVVNLEAGEYFFHYTTRDAAFGGILPNRTLRLSSYGKMRDPLENQPWRFTFTGYGERDDAALTADLRRYAQFEEKANKSIRDCSHLLSLTVDAESQPSGEQEPFCRGWARARMWEQYAENHRGVCLVFDRKHLAQSIEESLTQSGFVAFYHQEVIYDGGRIESPLIDWNDLDEPDFFVRYIEANRGALFFKKTLDWETEHEYRFVAISQDESPLSIDYGHSLTAVIVGEQLPRWEHPSAITACHEAEADPLLMKWKNRRPGLIRLDHEMIRPRDEQGRSGPPAALPMSGDT